MSSHKTLFSRFARAEVNTSSGVVSGVSVITIGEARGHYKMDDNGNVVPMMVDETTLEQVKQCAESYAGGLKVKLDHGSGAGAIVGVLKEFRLDGDKLRADLHLLDTSPHRAYVLELAQTMPESVGLSIVFSGESEFRDGGAFARCTELYSCDLVDEPAANPAGLLSKGSDFDGKGTVDGQGLVPAPATQPNPQGEQMSDELKTLTEQVNSLSAQVESNKTEMGKLRDEFAAKVSAEAEKQAFAIIKKFSEQFGAPVNGESVKPSAEQKPEEKQPETFEAKVREHYESTPKESRSKANSIKLMANKHVELHRQYVARVSKGEKIDL